MRYCPNCNKEYLEKDCEFYGEHNPIKGMLYCPVCKSSTERKIETFLENSILCIDCLHKGMYYESDATWFNCNNKYSDFFGQIIDEEFSCSKAEPNNRQ